MGFPSESKVALLLVKGKSCRSIAFVLMDLFFLVPFLLDHGDFFLTSSSVPRSGRESRDADDGCDANNTEHRIVAFRLQKVTKEIKYSGNEIFSFF